MHLEWGRKDDKELLSWLLVGAGVLVGIHSLNALTGYPSWQLERLFHLGLDSNVPTWYASLLLGICALAAHRCALSEGSKLNRWLWTAVSIGFLVLSIDEVAMMHENLSDAVHRHLFKWPFITNFKATAWPITAAPFIAVVLAAGGWAVRKCLQGSVAAAGSIGLGVFLMLLGGCGLEMATNLLNHDSLQWLWEIEIVAEEFLEMLGSLIVLRGLLLQAGHLRALQGARAGEKIALAEGFSR